MNIFVKHLWPMERHGDEVYFSKFRKSQKKWSTKSKKSKCAGIKCRHKMMDKDEMYSQDHDTGPYFCSVDCYDKYLSSLRAV